MAVAIQVIGSAKRIDHGNDEEMLKVAARLTFKEKPLKLIELKLKDGLVRGGQVGGYKFRGLQTVTVIVNGQTGNQSVSHTTDNNGNPCSTTPVKFTPDGYGGRYCHIPDTEYNRAKLVKMYGKRWIILDENIDKEVGKLSDARMKRMANAQEKALESAKSKVHAKHGVFIEGLKKKIGDGFESTSEYQDVIGKEVKKLAYKIFTSDRSWEDKPSK